MIFRRCRRAGLLVAGFGMCTLISPQLAAAASPAPLADAHEHQTTEHISVDRWTHARDFASGRFQGTRPADRARSLTIAHAIGQREYTDPFGGGTQTWEYAQWVSPVRHPGFGVEQLVASWTADTPRGTWLQVEMRGTTGAGENTGWYVMGRWAALDVDIHRTTVPDQGNEYGWIAIDTFKAADGVTLSSYQLRVTLYRLPDGDAAPALRSVSAMTSAIPDDQRIETSPPGGAAGTVLDVPTYSQNVHNGHYPQWDGGGEAWCSPTSTAMVLSYWGRGPSQEQMDWIPDGHQNPMVDFAARGTYDYSYEGAGNWPFNVAYAGRFGMEGFVTRLHSLTEMEQFIKAGIPVITSESFTEEELPGAGYGTNGHLLVVVGFTEDGDVVVNDPAGDTNDAVRRVYQRDNFENVWQGSTGGISYIIHPPGYDLPDVASLR